MFRFVVLPCFVLVLSGVILSSYGLIHAIDSTDAISKDTYSDLLKQNFTRAIIRGYSPACSTTGGGINPSFVTSYKNAKAAGYADSDIQTYWVPCNGNGNKPECKGYEIQIKELLAMLNENNIAIGTIWLDFERDADCPNNWNYGNSGNIAQAQSLLAALKSSTSNFGIYTIREEWNAIFGSDFTLDSSVSLWIGNFDGNQDITLSTPFGGWTTAVGHQYALNTAGSVPFHESIKCSPSCPTGRGIVTTAEFLLGLAFASQTG